MIDECNTGTGAADASRPDPTRQLSADDPADCLVVIDHLVHALRAGPQSRPRSLAATKLEEARMWLGEAMRTA